MKKHFLFLTVSCIISFLCSSQTIRTLQSNLWYCVGDWENQKHVMMTVSDKSSWDSEVKFLPNGHLERISADEKNRDTLYTYTVKKGILKIDKTASLTASEPKIRYYKLNLLQANKVYELIPKTETEALEIQQQQDQ